MNDPEKRQITTEYRIKSTSYFAAASVALVVNSCFELLQKKAEGTAAPVVLMMLSLLFFVFSYAVTIMGFSKTSKACNLSDEEGCYFLGKNLKTITVVFFVVTILCEIFTVFAFIILKYYGKAGILSDAENAAAVNIKAIAGIILIVMQIFSISTVYIIYLSRLQKVKSIEKKTRDFALFADIVLIVQLVLGVISSAYYGGGVRSPFLTRFSAALQIIKYIVLFLFFMYRIETLKKSDASETKPTEIKDEN